MNAKNTKKSCVGVAVRAILIIVCLFLGWCLFVDLAVTHHKAGAEKLMLERVYLVLQ